MSPPSFDLTPPQAASGDLTFVGTDISVAEFWSWALGDLAMNVNRSLLAEFLVARALGDERPFREEWANFDVLTPEGIRVEVKSAAYLQRWAQAKPSAIRFGGFSARSWDPATGRYADAPSIRCDVFVFAVQTCQDPALYDPYDVRQWEFYVVNAETVRLYSTRSAGLAWLQRVATPVTYDELAPAVTAAGVGPTR